ncbi:MAG: ATP-binding protein, partial [Cellulomonadaceae bacterium]
MREIRLGDPIAVDGAPLPRRVGALVRALLDANGRAVSAEILQDELWPAMEVADPAAALHALVSRARRLGVPVERFGGAYRVPRGVVRVVPDVASGAPGWSRAPALIGRSGAVAALHAALRDDRLVTVLGPGGVGKTALVSALVDGLRAEGGNVAGMAELAATTEPADVRAAVLDAAGAPRQGAVRAGMGGRTLTEDERLAAVGRDHDGGELVVVVDNCEHVLDEAAAIVARLLEADAGLRVVATSRRPLGLRAERVLPLAPLEQEAGVELARRRIDQAGGRPEAEDVLRTLVRRVDALPLAIELAAARTRALDVTQILATLDTRDAPLRDLPERHSSLWALLDWSWRLLEADQRRTLAAAALARGVLDVPLLAALGNLTERTALQVASGLIDASLLQRTEGGWRMLETVREHALARLRAPEPVAGLDERIVLDRLAAWAQTLTRAAVPALFGAAQVPTLDLLDRHRESLLGAAEHSPAARWPVAAALGIEAMIRGTQQTVRAEDIAVAALPVGPPDGAWAQDIVVVGTLAMMTLSSTGRMREAARVWRQVRAVLDQGAGADLDPRVRGLVLLVRTSTTGRSDAEPADLARLRRGTDPLLRGFARLARAFLLTAPQTQPELAVGELERAYEDFTAAQVLVQLGEAAAARPGRTSAQWFALAEEHFEAVSATTDASVSRIVRDAAAAVGGDEDAARRLQERATAPGPSFARPYVHLGLGLLAGVGHGDWPRAAEQLREAHTSAMAIEGVTSYSDAMLAALAGAAGVRAGS